MSESIEVNAPRTAYKQHKNGKGVFKPLQSTLHESAEPPNGANPEKPFPYLEDIMSVASKYPYSALGIMIGIAGIVIAAVVTVAVAGFTGVFLMYGELTSTRTMLQTISEQQHEIKGQVQVIKTLHQATLARQDFMNGLMNKENQDALNAYDRTHPRIPVEEKTNQ